jgi:hypothetical protein
MMFDSQGKDKLPAWILPTATFVHVFLPGLGKPRYVPGLALVRHNGREYWMYGDEEVTADTQGFWGEMLAQVADEHKQRHAIIVMEVMPPRVEVEADGSEAEDMKESSEPVRPLKAVQYNPDTFRYLVRFSDGREAWIHEDRALPEFHDLFQDFLDGVAEGDDVIVGIVDRFWPGYEVRLGSGKTKMVTAADVPDEMKRAFRLEMEDETSDGDGQGDNEGDSEQDGEEDSESVRPVKAIKYDPDRFKYLVVFSDDSEEWIHEDRASPELHDLFQDFLNTFVEGDDVIVGIVDREWPGYEVRLQSGKTKSVSAADVPDAMKRAYRLENSEETSDAEPEIIDAEDLVRILKFDPQTEEYLVLFKDGSKEWTLEVRPDLIEEFNARAIPGDSLVESIDADDLELVRILKFDPDTKEYQVLFKNGIKEWTPEVPPDLLEEFNARVIPGNSLVESFDPDALEPVRILKFNPETEEYQTLFKDGSTLWTAELSLDLITAFNATPIPGDTIVEILDAQYNRGGQLVSGDVIWASGRQERRVDASRVPNKVIEAYQRENLPPAPSWDSPAQSSQRGQLWSQLSSQLSDQPARQRSRLAPQWLGPLERPSEVANNRKRKIEPSQVNEPLDFQAFVAGLSPNVANKLKKQRIMSDH